MAKEAVKKIKKGLGGGEISNDLVVDLDGFLLLGVEFHSAGFQRCHSGHGGEDHQQAQKEGDAFTSHGSAFFL